MASAGNDECNAQRVAQRGSPLNRSPQSESAPVSPAANDRANGPPRRVVKLGGSLLSDPQLRHRWQAWWRAQPRSDTLIVVGGGCWVDAVREADERHSLGEEASHWLAIDALRITARLAGLVLGLPVVAQLPLECPGFLAEHEAESGARISILDVSQWLRDTEWQLPGHVLPHTWNVTADSIAARVADVWQAHELVLCKSVSVVDPLPHLTELVAQGVVDAEFPAASRSTIVRIVNLRNVTLSSA